MKAILEGLLFVVGDEGITLDQISSILEIDVDTAKELVKSLKLDYENETRGLRIDYLGNSIKMTTKKEHKEYYRKLIEEEHTLSSSALETLAIIAYNEPVTRVMVDDIRGISSSQMIRKLVAKGFVKACGKSKDIGHPILYKTTDEFLDYFGLNSKDELPKIEEDQNKEETELFTSKYKESLENNE